MLELLPFAALFGAAGFGGLIKRYIYVRRREGSGDGGTSRGRPRIQVTGPKVQPLVCQICLGRIKEGTEYVKCSTGKVFHSVCLARVGSCPFCQRTVAIKGMESTTTAPHTMLLTSHQEVPEESKPVPEPAPAEAKEEPCPVCGAPVKEGATSCLCGAIFVEPGSSFACPECGAEVREGDRACPGCGGTFEKFEPQQCPVCGREVAADAEMCDCGAILTDRCPECGAILRPEDQVCTNCGAEFDFI